MTTPSRALALTAALALAALVAGCGKMGQLERPGPLFGNESSTTRDADEANRQAQDPSRPVDTIDPRERATDPAPPRTLPIQGTNPDPTGSGPQGALPNPYANPRQ
jgi:predicted small lipoprotein YifL